MNYLHFIISLFKTIFLILYSIIYSWILFFIPKSYLFKNVENKIVLITGAGSGVGAGLAVKFAKRKCRLVLWDINKKGLENTMEHCRKYQSELCINIFVVDVTDRDQVFETASKVKSVMGPVDILINNAGIVNGKNILDLTYESVVKTFNVNIMSHFWTVQAFLPDMLARDSGHIVSIASMSGYVGVSKLSDYCASKSAAIGFQESLMNELHYLDKTGINILTVCPVYINTGMFKGVKSDFPFLEILDADYIVMKIEEAILTNTNILMIPKITYLLMFFKSFLPIQGYLYLADFIGVNKSMDTFLGRE